MLPLIRHLRISRQVCLASTIANAIRLSALEHAHRVQLRHVSEKSRALPPATSQHTVVEIGKVDPFQVQQLFDFGKVSEIAAYGVLNDEEVTPFDYRLDLAHHVQRKSIPSLDLRQRLADESLTSIWL